MNNIIPENKPKNKLVDIYSIVASRSSIWANNL